MLTKATLEGLFQDTETVTVLRNSRIHTAVREHDYTLFQLQEHVGLHYSTISCIEKQVATGRRSKNKTPSVVSSPYPVSLWLFKRIP